MCSRRCTSRRCASRRCTSRRCASRRCASRRCAAEDVQAEDVQAEDVQAEDVRPNLNKVLRLGNGYERGEDYVSYVVGNIVSPNKFERPDYTRFFQGLTP